jgi:hypothetical protein
MDVSAIERLHSTVLSQNVARAIDSYPAACVIQSFHRGCQAAEHLQKIGPRLSAKNRARAARHGGDYCVHRSSDDE